MVSTSLYDEAEALRKAGKLDEAEEKFAQLWRQQPSQMVGWRLVYCLRKQGKLKQAEQAAREVFAKYPKDKFTISELGWVLYDAYLKPAREDDDFAGVAPVLKELAQLPLEGLTLTRVSLVAMRLAKSRNHWDIVLEWADRLKPQNLEVTPITFQDGKKGMPDRETWYVNRAHALYELKRYTEAREQAQAGLKEFPNELWLGRYAAMAVSAQGNIEQALSEYRNLVDHPRADWYVKAELAELEYLAGNLEHAYQILCESLQKLKAQEFKLPYFVTMSRLALTLGKPEIAAEHIALAKAIRLQNQWKIPKEQVDAEKAIEAVYPDISRLPSDVRELTRMCLRRWREGASLGLPRAQGRVKAIAPERHFTFISRDDGGEDVYVHLRDLPEEAKRNGAHVEFALMKSYDKKKERESFVASDVIVID